MKKYVKPVMESEAFVANEFISTCYTVTCGKCGSWEEGYDLLAGSIQSETITNPFNGEVLYTGTAYDKPLANAGPDRTDGSPCTNYSNSNKISIFDCFDGFRINWEMGWKWLIQQIYGHQQSNIWVHQDFSIVPNWTHTTNHPNASV